MEQLQNIINRGRKRTHESDNEEEDDEIYEEEEEEEKKSEKNSNNLGQKRGNVHDVENGDEEEDEDVEDDEQYNSKMSSLKMAANQGNNKKQKEDETFGTPHTTDTNQRLVEKYAKLVSKKNYFGKSNAWCTLKFNVLMESSNALYYVIQMEFSSNEEGEQLNIWLKATYINDVLKIIAEEDPDAAHLFNGFENVIINGATAELHVTPSGDNVGCSNTKDGYTYKEYVNTYLIPKKRGAYKTTVQEFTTTMLKLLRSPHFFSMMTVYQTAEQTLEDVLVSFYVIQMQPYGTS
jgi:hypothetical protein